MSLLREIANLTAARPNPAAPPDVVADWLDRKAALLDGIAADPSTTPDESAQAKGFATSARAYAARLRAGIGGQH